MALTFKTMLENYNWAINDQADERTTHWFFVHSPIPVIGLLVVYLLFVCYIGPRYMRTRKPFNIDNILIVYNIFQVIACAVIVIRLFPHVWKADFFCEEIDYSQDALSVPISAYFMYCLKIVDLLDTVFFVLRKKVNQVTFLHVYHHTIMVAIMWICLKYFAGGQLVYLGLINSFVHIVMYFYYLLTTYDAQYKKSVWWKKHITQLQLLQFFLISLYMAMPLTQKNCNYPVFVPSLFLPQMFVLTVLFANFYYKTYIRV